MNLMKSIRTSIELTIVYGSVILMLGILGGSLGILASFTIWQLFFGGVQASTLGRNIAIGVLIGVLIGVPIALWAVARELAREQQRGRAREGRCIHCGYSLTGLTELRCPECGQPFEPKGDAA